MQTSQSTLKKSNSRISGISFLSKISEWNDHFQMRRRGRDQIAQQAKWLNDQVNEYTEVYSLYTGKDLQKAKIFEVGYGARPLRLMWLLTCGFDASGIDLDRPILHGHFREFYEAYRKNGWERVLKSFVRHFAFDRKEWKLLMTLAHNRNGQHVAIDQSRFHVGDATSIEFAALTNSAIDFVYCEDVLEHIPANSLSPLIATIAACLSDNGCAVLRPNVFTGIGGGHLAEWYPHLTRTRLDISSCRSEPWEHLRKRRFKANTFLNEARLQYYRDTISRHLVIVDEVHHDPLLARRFLTCEVAAELQKYSQEELLANTVRFICKKR